MDCSGKKTDLFQCPNVPVARGYDLDQSIEQFWIIVPPLVWPMKVADMYLDCGSRLGIATERYRRGIRVTTHEGCFASDNLQCHQHSGSAWSQFS